jgi:SDR family mycofactocin-dependent oxidoreductase
MGKLDGRVALVTGAARGQGRSHALALAAEGAAVAISDIAEQVDTVAYPMGTEAELEETSRLVEKAGGRCLTVVADIRDSEQVGAMVDRTVSEFGAVDILVANAAICAFSPFGEITDTMWDDMIQTNLGGTFKCMRAVMPHMIRQGYGRVVATGSMSGRAGNNNLAHYCASKFGVVGLVKTFALEVAGLGITANVVCPSTTATPMVHNPTTFQLFRPDLEAPTTADVLSRFADLNPLRVPWLEPETISRAVLYLVTDEGFITGSTLEIGLGLSAFKP